MIRLRTGYVITGIITGFFLVLSFLSTIPDGKLHIVFCDVGQGDGIYVRFPDGKDMVVDGGPNSAILSCLSRHMPFWDRTIDIALLSHPQKDHMNGLLSVFERYQVHYFVHSDVANSTEGFSQLKQLVAQKKTSERLVTSGDGITVGHSTVSVLWPSRGQIALMKPVGTLVLGASTDSNLNDASVVFSLSYGTFDALFPGDADSHVDGSLIPYMPNISDGIDVMKVPHHGSKTGMTDSFVQKISKQHYQSEKKPLAVISVGKNSFGHPAPETIAKLESAGFQVLRTDKAGDIEVVSDGKGWEVSTEK